MNLKESNIQKLIEDWGATGLGIAVLLKDFILRTPNAKLSDIMEYIDDYTSERIAKSILDEYGLFYSLDGSTYWIYNKGKSEMFVDDAYDHFNFPGIKGRFFTKMKQVYGLTEEGVIKEFEAWKEHNAGHEFKDSRHLENSFSFWLKNRKPESKPKETIDWSSL